jgi:2-isopropylmalate synthase
MAMTTTSTTTDPAQSAPVQSTRVRIFDTTLRDGEQSPGAAMTFEEKLEVADYLDTMGVDIIEAGFPSPPRRFRSRVRNFPAGEKRQCLRALARRLQRYRPRRRGGEARAPSAHPHLHFHQPGAYEAQAEYGRQCGLDAVGVSVAHARNLVDDVQWSAEDATRTDRDFLCRCVELAIRSGATTINIPDTVGYATPQEFFELIQMLFNRVPNIDKAAIATHCHNDLGLAVANSLAGVLAGARQVECTINGIGERAGNAALEEIVMALKVRKDLMPFATGVDTKMLLKASKLVSTSPASRCSTTRRSSARTPSATKAASIRTAC